ncbi:acyltransferase family protein [Chthonobacter albigriseus]|uniref:acyltransferase family protein n=1 Tax=Chthonobacter albigriseus TaxID=1683161 RepID=UPI0015EF046D|nr:acyltransferase [Chthonobacter albigriseus]
MKHRTEIDGLRAIAVLPVILNHAKFSLFSGGYVGVDVFFVISGFLISSIIVEEVDARRFSIINFYERRARRIIPALAVVITASFAAAILTLLPDDLENFAQSVVATMAFANNVLLTLTSGYWELASDFKPLLHTWSLGVEEQFYLLYPLVALTILRFARRLFPVVLVVGILASLALSIVQTPTRPNAAFYLLHTRAWELLLGALAAYYAPRLTHGITHERANTLSLIGLALLAGSIVGFTEELAYPSHWPLLPCVGAALILVFAFPSTMAGRILSLKVLVGVGLISYSAYLWHQPLFAFARVMSVQEPSAALMGLLSLATLGLAYLSWRFVEQPFRDRRFIPRWPMFGVVAAASIALMAAGFGVFRMSGLPERFPGIGLEAGRYIAYNERVHGYRKDRFETEKPRLLVTGNSVARDFFNVILESGRFETWELVYRDDLDVCIDDPLKQPGGELFAQADAVVATTNWTYSGDCDRIVLTAGVLAERPFVLVGPKHFGYNLNAYMRTPAEERPNVRAHLLEDTGHSNAIFRRSVPADHYVDLQAMLNERFGGTPVFDAEGRILSADRVHLTKAGAAFFASFVFDNPAFAPVLAMDRAR